MKRVYLALATVLAGVLLFAGGGWLYMKTAMHGFSARAEPSHMEAMIAEFARDTAMPASARSMKNPVVLTPAIQQEAMAHYADHCAICHANNGSGQSMFGKGMYPKPPDLRGETQDMSDGEIFYDIENGVRMSGMPAFGGDGTADDTWKLVGLIRHLPHLTPAEETEMEALNPKTPEEAAEEKQEEEFLNGNSSSQTPTNPHQKGHTR
ncbi:MAG: cytochrome C [Acidobacteria bacterium]|nr:cytochrome C [Acidobacteriota bacterium]